MSMRAMNWALAITLPSSREAAVLLVLAHYADKDGVCWPSMRAIASGAKCSLSTAHRAVRVLAGLGLLACESRLETGGQKSNVWRLRIPSKGDRAARPPPVTRDTPPLSTLTPPPCHW